MSSEARELISALREAFERIARKAQPLLEDPALLDTETGRDLLDVICMQFLASREALKRVDKLCRLVGIASTPH